ncbi:hypothetical protein OBBRIDRAFT_625064 [Obba rivulosa]|uniref:Secreted protein n=1 Tax=Obba rivulosa TaxID=1052685 RepID=A0A8E2B2M5_9APHY|nr:hypothetical protein OBBRIDRAFT_625064 [Obba rivulosa]
MMHLVHCFGFSSMLWTYQALLSTNSTQQDTASFELGFSQSCRFRTTTCPTVDLLRSLVYRDIRPGGCKISAL